MTAQYWDRKLTGSYVYHQGKYVEILGARMINRDERDRVVLDFRYPEEYLPYMKFMIYKKVDNELRWEDFEIKFPEEGYKIIDKVPIWGSRTMQRAWKIAPHNENFLTRDAPLGKWLNTSTPRYDNPADIYSWKKHQVFNNNLAAKIISASKKDIEYKGECVFSIHRTVQEGGCYLRIEQLRPNFLGLRDNIWGDKFAKDQGTEYKFPKDDPYKLEDIEDNPAFQKDVTDDLSYDWCRMDRAEDVTEDFDFYWSLETGMFYTWLNGGLEYFKNFDTFYNDLVDYIPAEVIEDVEVLFDRLSKEAKPVPVPPRPDIDHLDIADFRALLDDDDILA